VSSFIVSATVTSQVFARWVSQKMIFGGKKSRFTADTIVTGWDTGVELVDLIEALSGHSMPNRARKVSAESKTKGRIFQINSCNEAIQWALANKEQGVKITLLPSAENFVDGLEVAVLGAVWAIILSYLNVGDEDLSATEALLRWVQRETAGYSGVNVVDFSGNSFNNGLAFCALIHKHRPDLIGDWDALKAENAHANIALAQDGAFKFFGLEKYIAPEEIEILDQKSLVVYVSEWYAGITGFARIRQSAQRISDFIAFNKEMAELQHQYVELATRLKTKFDPAVAMLQDEQIDDTYAGAERKLNEFLHFKEQVKVPLTAEFLQLEALMARIVARLASANRPPFTPPAGLTVPELRDQFKTVESAEAVRHAALVAELNRQISLRRKAEQHAARLAKIGQRADELEAQLTALNPAALASTADAKYQKNQLTATQDELRALKADSLVAHVAPLTAALVAERYENAAALKTAEQEQGARLDALLATAGQKASGVDAALALNEHRDEVVSLASQHKTREGAILAWADRVLAQVSGAFDTSSITATQGSLTALKVLQGDRSEHVDNVASFTAIGDKIKAASHGDWSPCANTISAVDAAAAAVAAKLATLDAALADKKAELEAALARNIATDEKHLSFAIQFAGFAQWAKDAISAIGETQFGFTLAEARAYNDDSAAVAADAAQRYEAIAALASADAAGSANPYAEGKGAAEAAALKADIDAALQQRATRYSSAVTTLQQQDAACAAFAAVADPFVADINSKKDAITNAAGSVAEQQATIAAAKAAYESDSRLAAILAKEWVAVVAADVKANPHTLQTDASLRTQWEQFGAFLGTKEAILADLQKMEAMRGLSQEQWDNARSAFTEFDKDGSGALSGDNLRSALHLFGESRTKEEVAAIVAQFGKDGVVTWEQFLDYAVVTLGGQNTKEKLEEAFTLVNQGHAARIEFMEQYLSKEDIAYIIEVAPKDPEGNVDLRAWIHQTYGL